MAVRTELCGQCLRWKRVAIPRQLADELCRKVLRIGCRTTISGDIQSSTFLVASHDMISGPFKNRNQPLVCQE